MKFKINEDVYFNISGESYEDKIIDISSAYLKSHGNYKYRTIISKRIFHAQWFSGYAEHEHGYITKIPTYPENIIKL